MSTSKNLMVTLTEAELEQLDNLSNCLGCSKSRVISQALNILANDLKTLTRQPILGVCINKTDKKEGK